MQIEFIAHACFQLTLNNQQKLITDPYKAFAFPDSFLYPAIESECHWVTISHEHLDHNCTDSLSGDFQVIRKDYCEENLKIVGIDAFHDAFLGKKFGGTVSMKIIHADALTICHTGDLGENLCEEKVDALKNLDVLILPIGGYYTIDAAAAIDLIKRTHPKIVIPSHFRTSLCTLPIDTPDAFLKMFEKEIGKVHHWQSNILTDEEIHGLLANNSETQCVFLKDRFNSYT